MTFTCRCGAKWTGLRVEHCGACHLTFSCTQAGDRHRTGTFTPDTRRCLDVDEMEAKGLTLRLKGHGTIVWGLPGARPLRFAGGSEISDVIGVGLVSQDPSGSSTAYSDARSVGGAA